MSGLKVTGSWGLLESFLARMRARMANKLIDGNCEKDCIVDIGCGSYPVLLLSADFDVKIGLERTVTGAGRMTFHDDKLLIIEFDLESKNHIPLRSTCSDVVTMLAVFEHISQDRVVPLLRECSRILKPGGLFVMTTPSAWTRPLLRSMAILRLVSPIEIRDHKDAYDKTRLSHILQQVFPQDGLRVGHFEMFMNLWAVAQKPKAPDWSGNLGAGGMRL